MMFFLLIASIKQLVGVLWYDISSLLRTTVFTLEAILSKGLLSPDVTPELLVQMCYCSIFHGDYSFVL
jgi:hypothetical protein